jgi:hypothetical protein
MGLFDEKNQRYCLFNLRFFWDVLRLLKVETNVYSTSISYIKQNIYTKYLYKIFIQLRLHLFFYFGVGAGTELWVRLYQNDTATATLPIFFMPTLSKMNFKTVWV